LACKLQLFPSKNLRSFVHVLDTWLMPTAIGKTNVCYDWLSDSEYFALDNMCGLTIPIACLLYFELFFFLKNYKVTKKKGFMGIIQFKKVLGEKA